MGRKRVVIAVLDRAPDRLDRGPPWGVVRALAQQPDLRIDRLELLLDPDDEIRARALKVDLRARAPRAEIRLHLVPGAGDLEDLADALGVLTTFLLDYEPNHDAEEYLLHTCGGTAVALAWTQLLVRRAFYARLLLSETDHAQIVDPTALLGDLASLRPPARPERAAEPLSESAAALMSMLSRDGLN